MVEQWNKKNQGIIKHLDFFVILKRIKTIQERLINIKPKNGLKLHCKVIKKNDICFEGRFFAVLNF